MVNDVNPHPLNALGPMLVIGDRIVTDVRPVAFRKALAPMLLYVVILALVAPYNNPVTLGNDPLPLNTLVIHDTVIPDFPYNVLLAPGMTIGLRLSSRVDSSKMAVVKFESMNALESRLVTEAGIVMDVIADKAKAYDPIVVTNDGMVIDFNILQLAKE